MSRRLMKPGSLLYAALAVCVFVAAGRAYGANPGNESIIEAWGRFVARETSAEAFALTDAQRSALVEGMAAGLAHEPAPFPLEKIYTDVTQFVEARTAELRRAQKEKNLAAAAAYFGALRRSPGVIELPSGLCYEVLLEGDGPSPQAGQTVTVKYHARLAEGAEFDSTDQLGAVDIALARIVPGWSEGIQKMRVGGKVRLHLPPALGFTDADAAMMGIPPGATTVAEIELIAIKDTPVEEPAPPPAPAPPAPAPAGFSDTQITETWGWLLAHERGVARADLDPGERGQFITGFVEALAGKPAEFDEKKLYTSVSQFVAGRLEEREKSIRKKREAENAAFFERLKRDPKVISLPSGLCYEILRAGEGAPPRSDQRVLVNYIGRLIDGTIFDRTDPEIGPLEVDIGRVIKGWTEGMQKIAAGGRISLYIPPSLGYGDVATGGIPAGATLIFDIELLKISDIPAK